jgi:hypothetical protein
MLRSLTVVNSTMHVLTPEDVTTLDARAWPIQWE